jgi:hypothetical protein
MCGVPTSDDVSREVARLQFEVLAISMPGGESNSSRLYNRICEEAELSDRDQ